MLTALTTPVLLAATIATGLTAGFLAAFAHTVMPGLARTDDATYVGAFQGIDRAVVNLWFAAPYVLGPILAGAALLLLLGQRQWGAAALVGVALVLTVATFVITGVVHLPLNRDLQDVALAAPGLAEARSHFADGWVRWNVVRAVTSTGAFVSLAVALGRLG